ncbi:MAG: ferredoxin--NADP reductase [Gammaproteobacteria bacterium]|nr:ferredoxin--NADP reductase [Gammaproteobacteria bacterium]
MSDWIEARVVENYQWNSKLFSLRFEADINPFKAGQFLRVGLDIGAERIGRPYSFVNAPTQRPIEIYFNIIPNGPLTQRLALLKPGDRFWTGRGANGFLILDEIPECRHLWLLATGTAIGPFLSILKTAQPWERFEKIVLAHSVRFTDELSFQDSIAHCAKQHASQFVYVPFVSRAPTPGAIHGRITTGIESKQLEQRAGIDLLPETSHVMLCGNSAMIEDTTQLLATRGMHRHRRREPGHISTEKYH